MIEEAYKRNIEIHTWLNPYRITTKWTNLNQLADNNPAKLYPEWVLEHNDALFYNSQNIDVINYIATTVFEIVTKYNIDGIHFDEYFYPYNYSPPDCKRKCICTCYGNYKCIVDTVRCRIEVINYMITMVYNSIKLIKPNVQFGISPFSIWKNKSSDINGSNTNGLEVYYDLYSDALLWIEEGIIDYIDPQIYWEIENKHNPYEILVRGGPILYMERILNCI